MIFKKSKNCLQLTKIKFYEYFKDTVEYKLNENDFVNNIN